MNEYAIPGLPLSHDMKRLLICIFFSFTVFCNISCTSPAPAQRNTDRDTANAARLLADSPFYKFVNSSDTQYHIEWGTSRFSNNSVNYPLSVQGYPVLEYKDTAVLIFRGSYGQSCSYYIILPLIAKGRDRQYLFSLAYNIDKHLVAYASDTGFINIENYLTGNRQYIHGSDLCPAATGSECIDSAYFRNDKFILVWQGHLWTANKPDLRKRIIDIDQSILK